MQSNLYILKSFLPWNQTKILPLLICRRLWKILLFLKYIYKLILKKKYTLDNITNLYYLTKNMNYLLASIIYFFIIPIFQLSISFSESLTEVFEYPSYESSLASPESNTTSILNAKNTSIGGSFGKCQYVYIHFNHLFQFWSTYKYLVKRGYKMKIM